MIPQMNSFLLRQMIILPRPHPALPLKRRENIDVTALQGEGK